METKRKLRGKLLTSVVATVITLIVIDVVFTYKNNEIIHLNSRLQKQAETVKVNTSQFAIVIIHNLDLGLRGYALFGKDKYLYPLKFALRDKDSIMMVMERILSEQQYPLLEFHQLRDSINAYSRFCIHLKELFDQNNVQEFKRLSDLDKGYHLWLQYEVFARKVYLFEDKINNQASLEYNDAIRRNYLVQIFLFIICVPALLIMASHTKRKFALVEELRKSDLEKAQILQNQNVKLEQMVVSRTHDIQEKNEELQKRSEEIAAQNEELTTQQEEISLQRDLLSSQNQKLNQANEIIETKSQEIQKQNDELERQVEERTKQLVEYNQQLEQFTFMAAHNLRGPVARILGLGRLLNSNQKPKIDETKSIVDKILFTTGDLDSVINDLGRILEVKSYSNRKISEVNLKEEFERVKSKLKKEIFESKASIKLDFNKVHNLRTVKDYFESILFHLLHNTIKFSHPSRAPVINIESEIIDNYMCLTIRDNGIGIDTALYKDKLFGFNQRFQTHISGRGIGLYLVKILMMALEGKIELESTVDVGTTVKVYFKNDPENKS